MAIPTYLIHFGPAQPLWQQPGLIQVGTRMADGPDAIQLAAPSVSCLMASLKQRGWAERGVLLHYSDPFLMRAAPLRGVRDWPGPKLLACGDLHHGPTPIDHLKAYLKEEPHDAVLLTFNPALLEQVQQELDSPIRCLPPSFFRYPIAKRAGLPEPALLHVGSLGPRHPKRRDLVQALLNRQRIPFRHAITATAGDAAQLYAQHALVLNVPLNNDLNHRFFEVMAAGVPQVVFGDPSLVGDQKHLAERPDVFWASNLDALEALVQQLFASPETLNSIEVAPPPCWPLQQLLKAALAP